MKKLLILLLIFLFIPTLSASAAESVSFSTGSVEYRNNRLIDVEVRAQSGRKPSAALFDFYFDKGLLEYRGASAPNGSTVVADEYEDRVRVSYLCSFGAEVSDSAPIFTLEFKTLSEGSAPVNFKVEDCVDCDTRQLDIGNCEAGTVTITPKASESAGKADNGSKAENSASEKSKSSKTSKATKNKSSKNEKETAPTTELTDLGKLTTVEQKANDSLSPMIVLCASVAALTALCGYIAFQIIETKRKNKSDK